MYVIVQLDKSLKIVVKIIVMIIVLMWEKITSIFPDNVKNRYEIDQKNISWN